MKRYAIAERTSSHYFHGRYDIIIHAELDTLEEAEESARVLARRNNSHVHVFKTMGMVKIGHTTQYREWLPPLPPEPRRKRCILLRWIPCLK